MRGIDYRTRNTIAGICSLIVLGTLKASASALPPDPDNAALVYYRAYLLDPGPDRPWSISLSKFISGDEPLDEKVKFDLRIREHKIEMIETAAKMPKCDWGIQYSHGLGYEAPHFPMMRQLANLLRADAQRLGVEGQYRAALERCLTIRQLARHVGDDSMFACLVARSVDRTAETSVQRILGIMPPDVDTLVWLKDRLSEEPRPPLSLDRVLKMDLELALQSLRTHADILARVRQELAENAQDENARGQAKNLTDGELVARARDAYTPFLNAALPVIHSGKSYNETYTRLKDLRQELEKEHGNDPAAKQIIEACADQVLNTHNAEALFTASSRALKVAIEVYIEIAKTGRVPFMPPESVLKDPYSDKDFEYETTKDGFLFRCRAPDLSKGTIIRPFEFKVHDPNAAERIKDRETPTGDSESTSAKAEKARDAPGKTETERAAKTRMPDFPRAVDLDKIIQDKSTPPAVRRRAEDVRAKLRARLAKGFATPEPLLVRVTLHLAVGGGFVLDPIGLDEDEDRVGLRIKEEYVDPNNRTWSIVEDYPVYADSPGSPFLEGRMIDVGIRENGQRKDAGQWEAYLIESIDWMVYRYVRGHKGTYPHQLNRPPVWISAPEPNKVRVSVSLYDRQGHESEYVEVENLLAEKPIDPLTDGLMLMAPPQ
jgi:hypothetical protein